MKNFVHNSGLLEDFLLRNKIDCLIMKTHNGKRSSDNKFGFKYIETTFSLIRHKNKHIVSLISSSTPVNIMKHYLNFCIKGSELYSDNFTHDTGSYFSHYKGLFFRYYNGVYYILLTEDGHVPSDNVEYYIKEKIDSFLHNKCRAR